MSVEHSDMLERLRPLIGKGYMNENEEHWLKFLPPSGALTELEKHQLETVYNRVFSIK